MDIKLPQALFIKVAALGTVIWLVISLNEIVKYDTSAKGKLDLLGFTVLGVILIMGAGFGAQWLYHFFLAKTRRQRPGD